MKESIGDRVRRFRIVKGLKPHELDAKADLGHGYTIKLETGQHGYTNPKSSTINALAKALGINPSELHYGNETRDRPPHAIDAPSYLDNDIPVISLVKAGRGGFFDDQGYPVGHGFRSIKRPEWIKDKHAYAVQVDGDSMSPALEKGWMVVVCPHDTVINGNLVIAKLGEEYLLKKVRFQDGLIILQSVNQAYDPIACKKNEIDFLHKVCLIKPK